MISQVWYKDTNPSVLLDVIIKREKAGNIPTKMFPGVLQNQLFSVATIYFNHLFYLINIWLEIKRKHKSNISVSPVVAGHFDPKVG